MSRQPLGGAEAPGRSDAAQRPGLRDRGLATPVRRRGRERRGYGRPGRQVDPRNLLGETPLMPLPLRRGPQLWPEVGLQGGHGASL